MLAEKGSGAYETPEPDVMTAEWANSLSERLQQGEDIHETELHAAVEAFVGAWDVTSFMLLTQKVYAQLGRGADLVEYVNTEVNDALQRMGFEGE